jgi:hypothetical protein
MQPNPGTAKKTGATILGRALQTNGGIVPPEGAAFILNLGIRDDDKKRALELLTKQQEGRITADEHEELEAYVQADNTLSILKAHAILALEQAGQKPLATTE